MNFFINIWNGIYSEGGVFVITLILISIFAIYAIDLILSEIKERNIYNILHKRLDIDDYLKEVSELIAKSRKKNKIAKYSIYKAVGLYYKGENENALEWLKKVNKDIENGEDIELKISYTVILFKILFRIGYNEKVDAIYKDKEKIIQKMHTMNPYKYEAEYLQALYEFKKGNYKVAREKFIEAKKLPISKLEKTMVSFQLAQVCLELGKIEEAEKEVEEVMNTKKKNKNLLFVYKELEKIIKERRSSNNTISSVDKDLEEQKQKEALEKMEKEVAEAIEDDKEIKENKTTAKAQTVDEIEESVDAQLAALKKDITEEMTIETKIGGKS